MWIQLVGLVVLDSLYFISRVLSIFTVLNIICVVGIEFAAMNIICCEGGVAVVVYFDFGNCFRC